MINKELIEEIRAKTDIVKVISEHVQLKKRGKNYLGLCPFHSEKVGSFTVSPEKQIFHCFGCNEGGNAFAFLMKMENLSFLEAVADLAGRLNITIPESGYSTQDKTPKEKLYRIMGLALEFFQSNLASTEGQAAQAYLKERLVEPATQKLFSLGFAPAGWDNLFSYLVGKGAAPTLIEKTGLALPREGKAGYYDRFRSRLIFPIIVQRQRVIAFGGRSLGPEEPKYLNSPDTPIYHKGQTLFGLNLSHNEIKKTKTALLVEGYFDLITVFQAGISNVVASLGTALTDNQSQLLAKYCDTVILGFDSDAAGSLAAEKSIELLRQQNLKVKVLALTDCKDPDEYVRKHGQAGFEKALKASLPYLEFKIRRILDRHNLKEIESRSQALQAISQLLVQETDEFVQKEYASFAAQLIKADLGNLLASIKRLKHYQRPLFRPSSNQIVKPGSKEEKAEKNLIILAVQKGAALNKIKSELTPADFYSPQLRTIAQMLFQNDFQDNDNIYHFLLEHLADAEAKQLLARLLVDESLSADSNLDVLLADCIKVVKGQQQQDHWLKLKQEIELAEKAGQSSRVAELLRELK